MRHDFHLAGHAFRLRPVHESDASYLVGLRSRAGQYLNRGARTTEEQALWLARYFTRPDDYYFVVETIDGRRREGAVGLYDVQWSRRTGEWGRFVVEPASNAAVESALLIYRFAFDELRLEEAHSRTLRANERVVSFHDSCGAERHPTALQIEHNGQPAIAIEHRLTRDRWVIVQERLERLASRFAMTTAKSVGRRMP